MIQGYCESAQGVAQFFKPEANQPDWSAEQLML
jgi:hypothetical protein